MSSQTMQTPRVRRPHLSGITLTPIRKRRAKISMSPVRSPKMTSFLRNYVSMDLSSPIPSTADDSSVNIPTAALEFEEFSFMDPNDGWMESKNLTEDQHRYLFDYLGENFDVVEMAEDFPFLVLRCRGKAPPEDKRPFTIAGAIAVWQSNEDDFFKPFFGEDGEAEDIEIEDEISHAMELLKVPPQHVIEYFAFTVFPDCSGIAVIYDTIVIEFPRTEKEEFAKLIQSLPRNVMNIPFQVRYWNGPLPNTERRKRDFQPRPSNIADLKVDETDYVNAYGEFYPGTMIQTRPFVDKNADPGEGPIMNQVTAGILINKGDEKRLTCSFHNWEPLVQEAKDLFGKDTEEAKREFRAIQGRPKNTRPDSEDDWGDGPGTEIGYVCQKVGNTDIALMRLHDGIRFENKFMEIDAAPKKLLHSNDAAINDEYVFDSFVTGKQTVRGLGKRYIKRVGKEGSFRQYEGPDKTKTNDPTTEPQLGETYITFSQGIYATTAEVTKKPHIRDSVCGSVLLRTKTFRMDDSRKRKKVDVTGEGGVSGMLHFADLQHKNSEAAYFLCYADVFDPLIDDGWTVCVE